MIGRKIKGKDIRKGVMIGLGLAAITLEKAKKIAKTHLKRKRKKGIE